MRSFLHLSSLLFLFVLLTACDGSPAPADPQEPPPQEPQPVVPSAVTSWLNQNAVPLSTLDPSAPLDDLAMLDAFVGDARIVALGEATHGTREFFRMKHRILRYLVEEKGFTAFAIEAAQPESFGMDRYVAGGPGDPEALLDDLQYWTWNTEAVLDQVEWMRAYNASAAAPLTFSGFDINTPVSAMDTVLAYVDRVDPDRSVQVQRGYACYRRYVLDGLGSYGAVDAETQEECRAGVDSVTQLLRDRKADYVAASDERAWLLARQHTRLVAQHETFRSLDGIRGTEARDRAMADNVQWLLNTWLPENTKIVLWAHNAHVDNSRTEFDAMGHVLKRRLGDQVRTIGFTFREGMFNAAEMDEEGNFGAGVIPLPAPPPPSEASSPPYVARYFATADASDFFLDLRAAQADTEASGWAHAPAYHRNIGAVYVETTPLDYYWTVRLRDMYDGVIHIDTSTPTRLLR